MNVPSAAGRQKLYLLLALLLSGNILLFYALPAKIFITIFLFLAITYFFIGGSNALLVTSALVASTIFVEAALQITPLGDSLYYRPHERFAIKDKDLKHGRYKANVDYEGLMPHGDLRALAVHTNVESEPREVVFQTDSWGFRNYEDYNGQPYVLVGDSFIVGNGTTQGETLAEQLRSRYAIDVYNLAHPGSVRDYAKYIRTFRKRLSDEPGVILFLFEGNDFPTPNAPQTKTAPTQRHWPSRVPGGWRLVAAGKWYLAPFKTTTTYKFAYSLISRVTRVEERVDVFPVRDITVAFLRPYVAVSKRKTLPANISTEKLLQEMRDVLVHMFFIPTKYRVYCKHIAVCSEDGAARLPNSQWLYLREVGERLGIATTDLTPALVRESDRLLEADDGVLTFWRDDTHWNKHGIAVAAAQVAKMLEQNSSRMYPE